MFSPVSFQLWFENSDMRPASEVADERLSPEGKYSPKHYHFLRANTRQPQRQRQKRLRKTVMRAMNR